MREHVLGGSSSKVNNVKEVYNVVRKHGEITKKHLQSLLDMPFTTLNRAVEALKEIGLIEEGGICESSMGRKPVFLKTKSSSYYLIGVEISRTMTKIVITDMSLNIIEKTCIELNENAEPEALMKRITANIRSMMHKMEIEEEKVLGIGVGAVGVLNRENGEILTVDGFASKKWDDFPIKQTLEKELDILTILDDGTNAAVLAEYWSDIGKKHASMVYISIGIGFRCGVISHGFLFNNRKHISNDTYGHIVVSANGRPCICGNQGCLKEYVTIPAIVQSYTEILTAKKASDTQAQTIQPLWERICESVKSGEKAGLNVITEAAFYLSAGLVNIINAINPEAIIIGGAAINSCGILYDFAVSFAKEKLKNINNEVSFYKGTYGEDEIAVGTATLILDYYLGKEISEIVPCSV